MKMSDEAGQSMVELAFAISILFSLMMATVDLGYLLSSKLILQNAVRQAGRYAITGQCITGTDGSCSQSRYDSIVKTLQKNSLGLLNSSNLDDITLSCTDKGGGCPNNAGGPGDIVTVSVAYPYKFLTPFISPFFPNKRCTIRVAASFMNEPFPPGQS